MDEAPKDIVDRTVVIEVDNDTCDRCGPSAKAYVFAQLRSGNTVTYCAHCGTRFWDELNRQAVKIVDLRYMVDFT